MPEKIKSNPYDIVRKFEETISSYTGAKYGIALESCSAAIFLCCKFYKVKEIKIPKFTYPSVACSIINAGGKVKFEDWEWQHYGWYELEPSPIIDSAKCLIENMYVPGKAMCLSFHGKKRLKIGRGGMVLTDNTYLRDYLKLMRFDGRHECALKNDILGAVGWNMYMTPEQAARGLELFQWYKGGIDSPDEYSDLSKMEIFK